MAKEPQKLDPSHELPAAPHQKEMEAGRETPELETQTPPRLPEQILAERQAEMVDETRWQTKTTLTPEQLEQMEEDYPADTEGTATA